MNKTMAKYVNNALSVQQFIIPHQKKNVKTQLHYFGKYIQNKKKNGKNFIKKKKNK